MAKNVIIAIRELWPMSVLMIGVVIMLWVRFH